MTDDTERPSRRRAVTQIYLLPKIKAAAQKAAEEEGQSLSNFIETQLAELLRKRGVLK